MIKHNMKKMKKNFSRYLPHVSEDGKDDFYSIMYPSNRSLNIHPPPLPHPSQACPGHLTSFPAQEGGNLMNDELSLPPGEALQI